MASIPIANGSTYRVGPPVGPANCEALTFDAGRGHREAWSSLAVTSVRRMTPLTSDNLVRGSTWKSANVGSEKGI